MFKWLRQLLAGDQSSVPEGAEVERDAQGRVVRVKQTLSAARPDAEASPHPRLSISEAAKPTLAQAAQWLCAQNIHAARSIGLGLERRFDFNQDDGLLRLGFDDDSELALPSQLIGSFDPGDRSFMWGWHNPSFQPQLQIAAQAAREAGRSLDAAAFDTPVQQVAFEPMTLLLAFAAQAAGCDGIYRAILGNHTSVFLGYRIPAEIPRLAAPDADFEARARARAEAYDRDQLEQDRYFEAHKDKDEDGLLRQVIAAKMESWKRDWVRDDDYWHPSSVSWPSEHDRTTALIQFMAPHPAGGVIDCRIGSSIRNTVYHLKSIGGEAKIVDQLIEWGDGFIWPHVD